jgi:hypothetical protein
MVVNRRSERILNTPIRNEVIGMHGIRWNTLSVRELDGMLHHSESLAQSELKKSQMDTDNVNILLEVDY